MAVSAQHSVGLLYVRRYVSTYVFIYIHGGPKKLGPLVKNSRFSAFTKPIDLKFILVTLQYVLHMCAEVF